MPIDPLQSMVTLINDDCNELSYVGWESFLSKKLEIEDIETCKVLTDKFNLIDFLQDNKLNDLVHFMSKKKESLQDWQEMFDYLVKAGTTKIMAVELDRLMPYGIKTLKLKPDLKKELPTWNYQMHRLRYHAAPGWEHLLSDTSMIDFVSKNLDKYENTKAYPMVFPSRSSIFDILNYEPSTIRVLFVTKSPYCTTDETYATLKKKKSGGEGTMHAIGYPIGCSEYCTSIPDNLTTLKLAVKEDLTKETEVDNELDAWRKQGVFTLATQMSYYETKSKDTIWSPFTKALVENIAMKSPTCIFVLLGKEVSHYSQHIKHSRSTSFIMQAPSLRMKTAFKKFGVFSDINTYLKSLESSNLCEEAKAITW
jgi:uracil DNA glycosylase